VAAATVGNVTGGRGMTVNAAVSVNARVSVPAFAVAVASAAASVRVRVSAPVFTAGAAGTATRNATPCSVSCQVADPGVITATAA
jgi:hypothetical protein